jgi:hypothetical protein
MVQTTNAQLLLASLLLFRLPFLLFVHLRRNWRLFATGTQNVHRVLHYLSQTRPRTPRDTQKSAVRESCQHGKRYYDDMANPYHAIHILH